MWCSFMMLPPGKPPEPDYDNPIPLQERQQKALKEASKLADEYLKNKS